MGEAKKLPDDPEERRRLIKTWARSQQEQIEPTTPTRPKQRFRPLAALDRYVTHVIERHSDTAGIVELPVHAHPDFRHYAPVQWHIAPRALLAVRAGRADTFVDFGAGKGRVVDQAARWPLRRVVGVEISAELAEHAVALVNAHRARYRCLDVEVVVTDATRYEVPDDMTIGFFYDPFRGETLSTVLEAIIASIDRRPRRVRLITVQPSESERFLATGRLRIVKRLRGTVRDKDNCRVEIFENV